MSDKSEADPILDTMPDSLDMPDPAEFGLGTREGVQEAAGGMKTPEGVSGTGEKEIAPPGAAGGDGEVTEELDLAALKAAVEAAERAKAGITADLRAERARRQEFEGRWNQIQEALTSQYKAEQAAKEEAGVPSKDDDPVGHLLHHLNRQQREQAEYRQQEEQRRTSEAQNQAFQRAAQATHETELQFSEANQDYFDALNYARGERRRLIGATHPQMSEQELGALIAQGDQLFALKCLQEGKNPAQEAYEAASRMGWKRPAAAQEAVAAAGTHNPEPAGSTPAPATNGALAPKAQPTMRSLSKIGGGAIGGRTISYEEFAEAALRIDPLDPGSMDPVVKQIMDSDALYRKLELERKITI